MTKMDITIERNLTIATGNYSNIKPAVNVTLRNIDVDHAGEVYEKLSDFTDALIAMEIIKMANEMETISSIGIKSYVKGLRGNLSKMIDFVKGFSVELKKIIYRLPDII